MRSNIASQIREEVVKRFEDVVTSEIRNHNMAIKKYQEDLKELNDSVGILRTEQEKLKQNTSKEYLISQTNMYAETKRIEDGFEEQRRHIRESRNIIKNKINEFENEISKSIGIECFDEFAKHVNTRLDQLEKKLEFCKKYNSEEIYSLNIEILKHIESLEKHNKKLTDKLEESFKILSQKLGIYKIDAKGITKDINVFKKDIYIIEKKIENIYTLIERLQKRS